MGQIGGPGFFISANLRLNKRYQPQGVLTLSLALVSTTDFALPRGEAKGWKPCGALNKRLAFRAESLTVRRLKPSQLDMKRYNQMAMVETISAIKKNVANIIIFLSPQTKPLSAG